MADFNNLSLYMAGVFTPRDPSYRSVILTDRVFLQEVDNERGVSNHILAKLDDSNYIFGAVEAIKGMQFPVPVQAASAQIALDQAIDDLNDMLRYAGYVILVMGFLMVVCLANTISMSTHDRTQEMGVLRSLGFERFQVMGVVVAEAVLLSLAGGALGCIGAFALLTATNQQIAFRGFTIMLEMRVGLLAAGLGAAMLLGMIGGIVPALRVARLPIVQALRRAE